MFVCRWFFFQPGLGAYRWRLANEVMSVNYAPYWSFIRLVKKSLPPPFRLLFLFWSTCANRLAKLFVIRAPLGANSTSWRLDFTRLHTNGSLRICLSFKKKFTWKNSSVVTVWPHPTLIYNMMKSLVDYFRELFMYVFLLLKGAPL